MRIAVFIDWQNAYKEARRAFALSSEPGRRGVFSPLGLARILAGGNQRETYELSRVEIHRGLPDARSNAIGNAAALRHAEAWRREHEVVVPVLRPLRLNRETGRPEEKGVDVALALGAVEAIIGGPPETVIIFSHDTDLSPLVETICRLRGADAVETGSWRSQVFRKQIPPIPGVFNHYVEESDFSSIETPINYARHS
jgi:hypothetical protein